MTVVLGSKCNRPIFAARKYLRLVQHCNLQFAFITNPLIRHGVLGHTDAAAVVPTVTAIAVNHESIQMTSFAEAPIYLFLRLDINILRDVG